MINTSFRSKKSNPRLIMSTWYFGPGSRDLLVLLKFGIPLAFSIGGFLYAKKIHNHGKKPDLEPTHQEIPVQSSEVNGRGDLEDFQKRFLQYCNLKEKETTLKELKHSLLLQMAKVEFLDRQILSMEAENQRLEQILSKYLKKLEEVESLRNENGFLHMKIKKLSTEHKRCSVIGREEKLLVEAGKTEVSRTELELQEKENVIRRLKEEIREFKIVTNRNQLEKNSSKMESDEVSYEVVRLRWANACLRHQLRKKNESDEL